MLIKLCESRVAVAFAVAMLLGVGWAMGEGWQVAMQIGMGALGGCARFAS